MIQYKSLKFWQLAIVAALFLAGCESSVIEDPIVPDNSVEKEITKSSFNLNELPVETDFTNLRVGSFTGKYLIISKNDKLPKGISSEIQEAGGEIVQSFPEIGVAVAISHSPAFLTNSRAINSIESVTPDFILQYTKEPEIRSDAPTKDVSLSSSEISTMGEPFDYGSAFFDGYQWAPGSIDAPIAWENGYTGEGVRVAIIDGGIHSQHIDLAPNLDIAASASFVPGFAFNEDTGTFWHGTHVAGIVAASGLGIVGIAPKATLVGVKALHGGSGAFGWILNAMFYAATPQELGGGGADIINMSLGALIDYRNNWQDPEFRDGFREFQKIYDRVSRYAYNNGVTIIAAAGNDGLNLDDSKEYFVVPAENQHVLSISSTGPTGWILGDTDFEQPAYYTNTGKSAIDFAAPGGTIGLWLIEGYDNFCILNGTYTSSINFCEVFDMVFSTIRGTSDGSYGWAQGTSMAAPAVAGVVALMMEANGGEMQPGLVKTRLASTATDLGKPGNDEIYGKGFVNAAKAVGIQD